MIVYRAQRRRIALGHLIIGAHAYATT